MVSTLEGLYLYITYICTIYVLSSRFWKRLGLSCISFASSSGRAYMYCMYRCSSCWAFFQIHVHILKKKTVRINSQYVLVPLNRRNIYP